MKSREEIMNMLEAFDLCGSLRGAGALAGVSHHTVDRYVAKRDEGRLSGAPHRGLAVTAYTTGWMGTAFWVI